MIVGDSRDENVLFRDELDELGTRLDLEVVGGLLLSRGVAPEQVESEHFDLI